MNENKTMSLSWGLFTWKWYRIDKHIRDIGRYIKRIIFVIKHGYPPFARWETFNWFIDSMRDILINYRYNRVGTGWVLEDLPDGKNSAKNEKCYDDLIDRMLLLLDSMDETDKIYKDKPYDEVRRSMDEAKAEFFELFSQYFYTFWD